MNILCKSYIKSGYIFSQIYQQYQAVKKLRVTLKLYQWYYLYLLHYFVVHCMTPLLTCIWKASYDFYGILLLLRCH